MKRAELVEVQSCQWRALDDDLLKCAAKGLRDGSGIKQLLNVFDGAAVLKLRRNHAVHVAPAPAVPAVEGAPRPRTPPRPSSRVAPSSKHISEWSLGWRRLNDGNAARHPVCARLCLLGDGCHTNRGPIAHTGRV